MYIVLVGEKYLAQNTAFVVGNRHEADFTVNIVPSDAAEANNATPVYVTQNRYEADILIYVESSGYPSPVPSPASVFTYSRTKDHPMKIAGWAAIILGGIVAVFAGLFLLIAFLMIASGQGGDYSGMARNNLVAALAGLGVAGWGWWSVRKHS